MPRVGMNPARNKEAGFLPTRVTCALLTHVPNEAGYFEHRFDSVKLCIESLIHNTQPECDILIFDNASSRQMVDYLRELRDQNRIQYLILSSRNIGKIDALQMIFKGAPGEIVAYSDDDVYFQPGWLERHLEILEIYPRVGMVTGFYIRSQLNWSIRSTLAFAQQPDVTCRKGIFWDRKWEQHYIENMGRTWEQYEKEVGGLEDMLLTYKGVQALVSAGHHQFVAYKDVIQKTLPQEYTGRLMGRMRELDEQVDQLGYLRLNTPEPVTRLIGNVVSPEMAEQARQDGLEAQAVEVNLKVGFWTRLFRVAPFKGLAWKVYNWLFKVINS
jgi:glycosyltransferase involved in cell wall biosynthesis